MNSEEQSIRWGWINSEGQSRRWGWMNSVGQSRRWGLNGVGQGRDLGWILLTKLKYRNLATSLNGINES